MDWKITLITCIKNIERILNSWHEREQVCATCPIAYGGNIPEQWLDRQSVIDYLGISARTYQRLKAEGVLVPRRIGGRDYYYQHDLVKAMAQSIRRGRV